MDLSVVWEETNENNNNSDNSTYCTYCSINNCIMFTHSIGIVTVIGQPNADNGRRIRASRVRTKVLRSLRDRQLQLQASTIYIYVIRYYIIVVIIKYFNDKNCKIHIIFSFQDLLNDIIILHTATLSNVYC